MKRERRAYQVAALLAQSERRMVAYFWTRRGRKSTTLGEIYFNEMSAGRGRTVINCSASLLLGKESIGMTLTALEQAEILRAEAGAVRSCIETNAAERNLQFRVANSATGKEYKTALSENNWTELYQQRAMELRLYFDASSYSRELVLAPSVQTFRSYRALVGLDEPGYMPSAQFKDLVDSADAMMRDTPDRRMLFACNLCLEDTHPWFTITLPREIAAENEEDQFPPNPRGHFYIGQTGMLIHRVALKDAYAAGHLLYDDESRPMTYDEARQFPPMRSGWNVSYALIHKAGGASVIDIMAMITAQRRGLSRCSFVYADCDADFRRALNLLAANLTDGPVGIGFDVATTTGELSNPSSVTVTEKLGLDRFQILVCVWKEKKPQVARERLTQILQIVRNRPVGGGARRLGIDASNERYFAEETADLLMPLIPVQLFIAGNNVDPRPPGYSEHDGNVNYKTFSGDNYAAAINDGRYALPPDSYLKDDHRMVMKDAGRFSCIPDAQTGAHGDTFDSGKLAELMLLETFSGTFLPPSGRRAELTALRRDRSVEG